MSQLARVIAAKVEASSLIRRMFEEGARLKAEFGDDDVCDFSLGNPHLEPPACVTDRLRGLTADPPAGLHRYMATAGFADVREKVAGHVSKQQGVAVPASHVVMTSGAACGLNVLLRAVCDPGDQVVCLSPFFSEYRFYCLHAGAECVEVLTTATFDPDPAAIAAALTDRTRVVIANSPNNPTGRVYDAAALDGIADVLRHANESRERPILLVSDDPYRKVVFDGLEPPTVLDRYPHTILCISFSKDLGLAGERIGYLAVHPDLDGADQLLQGLALTLRTLGFVNAPALMQRAVADCLDAAVDVAAYERNRDLLCDGLADIGYDLVRPQGTFFAFPAVPGGDDAAFCERLRQERVLAVPGRAFGRAAHMRLSFAVAPAVIERALPRFAAAFREAVQ